MGIARQCMQDQDTIVPRRIGLAPCLIGNLDLGQPTSRFEIKGGKRDQPALARFVRRPDPGRRILCHPPFAARNPASRSARMSSIDSIPTESRTRSGLTPAVVCSASVSWEWVVVAG
jgi:hypothetical protein